MAFKFLNQDGLEIVWRRFRNFIEGKNYIDSDMFSTAIDAVDEVKADKPTLASGETGTVEEYVAEYVANNTTSGEILELVCGDSTTNI